MKSDERRFLRKCLRTAVFITAALFAVLWIFDTMFNGLLLEFFAMLLRRPFRGETLSRGGMLGYGALGVLIISSVGVIAAYRTYAAQHSLFTDAKNEADRASMLAQTEAQRKSDLITYLAHDLKTPLASVVA
ncbi:MAG: hypothetical protein LBD16_02630, partial [Oscillospiraceae bacterium]|nr:hypothetical protein [Oscillospiraceae bacterium]